jgi:hypothetical protein
MTSEAGIKKYIYDWLVGLNLGPVFQDRKPWDDTTKLRNLRTYIVYDFPDGIENEGPWFHGICTVCIGCRDKEKFVADMTTLDNACTKFLDKFDWNDEENGVLMIDPEYDSDYSDGVGNHEYRYFFEIYIDKK